VILSGFGVQVMNSLAFTRVFIGTAKPDMIQETRHFKPFKNAFKLLVFSLLHPFLP